MKAPVVCETTDFPNSVQTTEGANYMVPDDKSGIGSLLLPILLISTVTLGFLYSGNLKELSKTQAQLEAERAERDRLEAVIHGVMLGGAR